MSAMVTVAGGDICEAEQKNYVEYLRRNNPGRTLKSLQIEPDGDYVNLTYEWESVPFERIRRITGYLVGTLDRFNDAKRAEERDRVKHGL